METQIPQLPTAEKKIQLFLQQKAMLSQFLCNGAITPAQYAKSLGDLTEKMGMQGISDPASPQGGSMAQKIRLTPITKHLPISSVERFGTVMAQEAAAFHRTLRDYTPTPMHTLNALADDLGLRALYIKDESPRFGLNAFKGLGGSFAMHKLAEGSTQKLTFVTATDGNHGRGVAWAAQRLGHEAYVYLPHGTSEARLQNILALGAYAEILDLSYDDTVRYAASMAQQRNWVLIQDTAWPGYKEIPALIMQGYTTMGLEIVSQLGDSVPTHILLQAGVGAMAGAMTAFFADYYGADCPKIIIVEPAGADCIFRTAAADDGRLHFCGADIHTIMAGLCCGEPCTLGWEILRSHADFSLACDDRIAELGMKTLAFPLSGDPAVISGESGAVTLGAVTELMQNPDCSVLRAALGLDDFSAVLCISTEGDTDPVNYRRIVFNESSE